MVIPKSFRQKLGLKAGDFIGMVALDDMIAIKRVEVPEEKMQKKLKRTGSREFTFEELLYPEKK